MAGDDGANQSPLRVQFACFRGVDAYKIAKYLGIGALK